MKLIKEYEYELGEKVISLRDCYPRPKRAIRVQNLF